MRCAPNPPNLPLLQLPPLGRWQARARRVCWRPGGLTLLLLLLFGRSSIFLRGLFLTLPPPLLVCCLSLLLARLVPEPHCSAGRGQIVSAAGRAADAPRPAALACVGVDARRHKALHAAPLFHLGHARQPQQRIPLCQLAQIHVLRAK